MSGDEKLHFVDDSYRIQETEDGTKIVVSPNTTGGKTVVLEVCSDTVVHIDKLFGPLIFCEVRIRADQKTADWVVEREWLESDADGNSVCNWREVARFDGQECIDFRDGEFVPYTEMERMEKA